MEYGSIQVSGGSTAQGSIGTSWVKLTGFDTLGPANGVGVNHGVDELNVESDGAYYAFAHLGFAGTLDAAFTFAILVDDVASGVQGNQDVNSTATGTATAYNVSLGGPLQLSAGDRVSLAAKANASGKSVTIKSGQLGLYKLG